MYTVPVSPYRTLAHLEDLFKNREKTGDAILLCSSFRDKRIRAHRFILPSSFLKLSEKRGEEEEEEEERKEPEEEGVVVVVVKDGLVTPEGLVAFLEYLYTGGVSMITPENLFVVSRLASLCGESALMQETEKAFYAFISVETALPFLSRALAFNDKDKRALIMDYIGNHTRTVFDGPAFLDATEEMMLVLLRMEKMNIDELALFYDCCKWCAHKNKLKREQSERFTRCVRYGCISPADLVEHVKPTNLAPPELYLLALEYHAKPSLFANKETTLIRSRYSANEPRDAASEGRGITITWEECLTSLAFCIVASYFLNFGIIGFFVVGLLVWFLSRTIQGLPLFP